MVSKEISIGLHKEVQALEHFILDDNAITILESYANKFNVFRALGLVHHEIRHSNFLGWLMDPSQTHGLDDTYLKIFLKLIYSEIDSNDLGGLSIFQLDGLNLSKARVLREWRNIDLTIVDDTAQIVVVIENKIFSKESNYQLEKYRKIVEDIYPFYKKVFVLLSPNRVAPENSDHYHPIGYATVNKAIEKLLTSHGDQIMEGPRSFINQYQTMLNEDIMDNSKLKEIVSEIYSNHKLAIDTIIQHLPDVYDEYSEWMYEILLEYQEDEQLIIIDGRHKSYQKFWFPELNFIKNEKTKWTSTGNILLCELENWGDKLTVDVILGPGPQEYRKMIHKIMEENNAIAISRKSYAKEWKRYRVETFFTYKSIVDSNKEEFQEKFRKNLSNFISKDLTQIRSVLLENKNRIEGYNPMYENIKFV